MNKIENDTKLKHWTTIINEIIDNSKNYIKKDELDIPEYQGASDTESGISGLVPPAAVEEKDFVLHGDGMWKKSMGEPDNITIVKNTDDKLVAQDIAINGDPDDLASERGLPTKLMTVSFADTWDPVLLDGVSLKHINGSSSPNQPHVGCAVLTTKAHALGNLSENLEDFTTHRIAQLALQDSANSPAVPRAFLRNLAVQDTVESDLTPDMAGPWTEFLMSGRVGDGIVVNNGIPSVPEYEGASATESGVAGLVPPATADEKDKFLGGDGLWHEVLGGSSFGEEGVTYIDTNTNVNTLLTPGLYITRKGMFTNVPGPATQDWGGGSYYMTTFADPAPGILIVTKDGNDILQHLLTKLTACMVIRNITNGTSFGGWYFSAYASSGNRGVNGRPNLGLVSPDTETIVTNNMGVLSVRKQGMIASTSDLGMIKADGTTCTIDADGTLHVIFPS